MIEKWGTHRVPYREFPGWFHEEAPIFKRSHSIGPCFTARINEATIDPARHFVYLQPHVFRATFHDLFPSIERFSILIRFVYSHIIDSKAISLSILCEIRLKFERNSFNYFMIYLFRICNIIKIILFNIKRFKRIENKISKKEIIL